MKIIFLITLILGTAIFASGQNGALSGTVYDRLGRVIPGADVVLVAKNGKKYEAKTNEAGLYKFTVEAGIYNVLVSAYGFEVSKISKYRLAASNASSVMLLDVALIGKAVSGHS